MSLIRYQRKISFQAERFQWVFLSKSQDVIVCAATIAWNKFTSHFLSTTFERHELLSFTAFTVALLDQLYQTIKVQPIKCT